MICTVICGSRQQFHFSILGCLVYITLVHGVHITPNQHWYCTLTMVVFFTPSLCSTLFIMSMTFDPFFSIIKPHKAKSFNTVNKAKITIICIVIFSIICNTPHFFITSYDGPLCLPFTDTVAMAKWYSQFYYWFSFVIQFALPFVLLLAMNSVIIHTLRNRVPLKEVIEVNKSDQGQGQNQGQKTKNTETQIFIILLLVTFTFLILVTPGYIFFILNVTINFTTSPLLYSGYFLFFNAAQKMYMTNYGINFFLYIISGQKFRTDLKNLFSCAFRNDKPIVGFKIQSTS